MRTIPILSLVLNKNGLSMNSLPNSPIILREGNYSQKDIKVLHQKGYQKIDIYEQQLEELFEISYPGLGVASYEYSDFIRDKQGDSKGSWVFLPWAKQLIHILNESDYFELRNNRNQYLINRDEQQKLQGYRVGVLGLSIGNSIAISLAYSSTCGELVLADKDDFSTTNLNRVRLSLADITKPKIDVTMQQIYEANPYAKIHALAGALTKDNLAKFFNFQKLIVFDELDDFEMKVHLRQEAKRRKVPVIMLTNLGDNVLIDIERYDNDPKAAPFNGLINGVIDNVLTGSMTQEDQKRFAAQVVGTEHIPTRALASLLDIGQTLSGRPQLFGTVNIASGLAPYIVRQIALGGEMPSGRYFFSVGDIFRLPAKDLKPNKERKLLLKQINHEEQKPITSSNYSAWEIKKEDFPSKGDISEKIYFLLRYGILAPSTHNTQPWQFVVKDNTLTISANPELTLPEADPRGRYLHISLGCCVTNIITAATYFELAVQQSWTSNKIKLTFRKSSIQTSDRLINAITARFSDKLPYQQVSLKKIHEDRLYNTRVPNGCSLTLISNRKLIERLAIIQQKATQSYSGNRNFFNELSQWLHPSDTKADDGMPGFVVGLSNIQSKVFRSVIKNLKPAAKLLARKDLMSVKSCSASAFITSKGDDPKHWFEVGKYYERLVLEATACGLATAPMTSIIENTNYRSMVTKTFGLKHEPQLFFRLGYSKHKPYHTPRRDLVEPFMKTQQQLKKLIDVQLNTQQMHIGPYNIHYVVAGKGEPLLMLHGANIGWAQWYQNIAELAKYFKIYALDLPGAGSSTKIDFHKADFEKDFVKIVDKFIEVKKLKNLNILGSSFGGWIALRLAIEKKPYINKIVLANPLGFTSHMPLQFRPVSLHPVALMLSKTALRPVRKNKNLEKFMRDVFFDKQLSLAPEFIDYFYELSKSSHNVLFISRLAHFTGMRKELFLKDDLLKIDRPVMVIWGKEDPLMPFWSVKDSIPLIPGVKLEKLAKVGHMPPVEAASKFNSLTINFLRR